MKQTKRSRSLALSTLFVCLPSPQADQTEAALRARLDVTRADNVCFAEMFAEAQPFEAAVYDESLSPEEQSSLARVMRIRWPWMRIIRWVSSGTRCGRRPLRLHRSLGCATRHLRRTLACLAQLFSAAC